MNKPDIKSGDDYHPTLWRTCRVLANPHRLACLKAVFDQPSCSVEEIAAATRLAPSKASMHLRALQSRGLLQALRLSRWVRYHPHPDPLVPCAAPILNAMKTALRTQPEERIIRTLTAFTHPRRLTLLRYLQRRAPVAEELLSAATQISRPALWRHLKKLHSRNLVIQNPDGWRLNEHPERLADTFLVLIAFEQP
jgi:DNA-binding transcriptional ArsR family regulator